MKIVEHIQDPAPPPPRTFDLLGLTEDEVAYIEFAVMRGGIGNSDSSPRLHRGKWSLYDALFTPDKETGRYRGEVSTYEERVAAVAGGAFFA